MEKPELDEIRRYASARAEEVDAQKDVRVPAAMVILVDLYSPEEWTSVQTWLESERLRLGLPSRIKALYLLLKLAATTDLKLPASD